MDVVDPVWVWIARLTAALLFAAAGLSKLRQQAAFRDAITAYELLPRPVVAPAALAFAAAEIAAAALLLWPAGTWAGALLLWSMLLLFSAAIAVNIRRGRTDIDCGCWMFGAREASRQTIGRSTLARNAGLAALVLVAMLPAEARTLGMLDWLTVLAGALAALGLFAIAAQLAANGRLLAGLRTART